MNLPGVIWGESLSAVVEGVSKPMYLGYICVIVFVSGGGQKTVRWKDVKDMDTDPDQVSS